MDTTILHDKIKYLLAEKGVTAKEMLRSLGLGGNFMTDLKKGSIPAINKIINISDYFGVPITTLLEGNITKQECDDLIETYSKLDTRGRQAIRGVALSELTRMENAPRLAEASSTKKDKSTLHSHPSQAPPDETKKGAPKREQ